MSINYKWYSLSDYNGKTVNDFVNKKDGFIKSGTDIYDFMMADNENNGLKNIEVIYNAFPKDIKQQYENTLLGVKSVTRELVNEALKGSPISNLGEWPVYNSPEIVIPNIYFNSDPLNLKGLNQFLVQKNIQGFCSEKLKQIITDKLYVRDENLSIGGDGFDVEIVNQNIKVWVWCRSINKIINVSPFILDMSTQKSDVGNFSISINPIEDISKVINAGGEDTINYFNLKKDGKFQMDFLHRNLQQNDIVFIRFERLKIEKEDTTKPYFDFEINSSELPGQVWDMIGLIDHNQLSSNFNSTDYSISLSGRDLMKLLVEDGAYFLSRAYIQSESEQFILVADAGSKGMKRNGAGKYDPDYYTFLLGGRKIDDSIGFIINQLSNLGVVDNDLFSFYGSKRTEIYKLGGVHDNKVDGFTVEGIWQIIKIFVDEQLEKRRIVDSSSVSDESHLLDQFMKLCQEPFVEFYGDTYGDEFNFVARQPPFTKEAIVGFIESNTVTKSSLLQSNAINKLIKPSIDNSETSGIIDINSQDIINYSLNWDETYYSWYQIVPNESMLGKADYLLSGGIFPILFFSKIAETYGNHRKIVVDNYFVDDANGGITDNYRSQLLNDLKFIVDTNIYLPFTRKGSITLIKGDRRIKKGTFIRLVPTQEICYVDGVSHEVRFSGSEVNRTTTITVSRCMIEKYIKGDRGYEHDGSVIPNVTFSYFNLVNTDLIVSNLLKTNKVVSDTAVSKSDNQSDKIYDYSVIIPQSSHIAYSHNNPGNLEWNKYQVSSVKLPGDRWASFPTPEAGFEELIRQIDIYKSRGLTVKTMTEIYMPLGENTQQEIDNRIKNIVIQYTYSKLQVVDKDTLLSLMDSFELAKILSLWESSSKVKNKNIEVVSKDFSKYMPVSGATQTYSVTTENKSSIQYNFGLDEVQFDFFQKRKQLNILDL